MQLCLVGLSLPFADQFTDVRDGHGCQDSQNGYHDQKFERFSGGPIGEVNSNGRIGVDVRNRQAVKQNPLEMASQKGQKAASPTLQVDISNKGE